MYIKIFYNKITDNYRMKNNKTSSENLTNNLSKNPIKSYSQSQKYCVEENKINSVSNVWTRYQECMKKSNNDDRICGHLLVTQD